MDFTELINNIDFTNKFLRDRAVSAVNISLTIRNWLVGHFIVEFEQNGEDRAEYGKKLEKHLSKTINRKGFSERNLKLFKQFYRTYPQLGQEIFTLLQDGLIVQTVSAHLIEIQKTIVQTLSAQLHASAGLSSDIVRVNEEGLQVHPGKIITKLSFSHITEILKIEDNLKRTFYEIECINGNWSVRELKRQIGSLLFERTGLSKNKQKVIDIANKGASEFLPENIIKDPYVFEFLGLKQQDVFTENKLEDLLIVNLQDFILELGKGFCFEARQKRIQIDNGYFYIDLVFYHKILKCNVLFELKTRKFKHSDISQLNVYLNYYKKYEMQVDDSLPVGVLLCTEKDREMVEFATAGLDQNLFVSKYQLFIPSKQELESFIKKQIQSHA